MNNNIKKICTYIKHKIICYNSSINGYDSYDNTDETLKKGVNIEMVKYKTDNDFVKSNSFKKNYINNESYI